MLRVVDLILKNLKSIIMPADEETEIIKAIETAATALGHNVAVALDVVVFLFACRFASLRK